MTVDYRWRGDFTNPEIRELHDDAFGPTAVKDTPDDWRERIERLSLGWVVAREGDRLVGFVNVIWDGLVHAWIQDTMVRSDVQGRGIGSGIVAEARAGARQGGCRWLHVDFEDHLVPFYVGRCGFRGCQAGVMPL